MSYEGGRGDRQQVKMLEEENAYLKKNFDVEIALLKDENDILKKQLMEVQHKRGNKRNNFSSPVRNDDVPVFRQSDNSPFMNNMTHVKQSYDKMKGDVMDKDRIIE